MSDFYFSLKDIPGFKELEERLTSSSHEKAKGILESISPYKIEKIGTIIPALDNSNNIYFSIRYDNEFIAKTGEIVELILSEYTTTNPTELNLNSREKIYMKLIYDSGLTQDGISSLIKNIGFKKTVNKLFPGIKEKIMPIYNSENYAEKFIIAYEIMKEVNDKIKNNGIEHALALYESEYENAKKAIEVLELKNSHIVNYNEILDYIDSNRSEEVYDKMKDIRDPSAKDVENISRLIEIMLENLAEDEIIISKILLNIDKFTTDTLPIATSSIDRKEIYDIVKKTLFKLGIAFDPNTITNEKLHKIWKEGDHIDDKFIVPLKDIAEIALKKLIDGIYYSVVGEVDKFIEDIKNTVTKSIVVNKQILPILEDIVLGMEFGYNFGNEYVNKYVQNRIKEAKDKILNSILSLSKNKEELKKFIEENQDLITMGTEKHTKEREGLPIIIDSNENFIKTIISISGRSHASNYNMMRLSILRYAEEKGFSYLKNPIVLDNILSAIDSLNLKDIKNILSMNMSNEEKSIIKKIYRYTANNKFK